MKKTIQNTGLVSDKITIEHLKEALLASEDNFKQLFNRNHIPQWIYDIATMQLLCVNDAAIKQYGYSDKEFLNMTMLELAPPDETQKLILYNEFMKTTNEPFSVVNFQKKKNTKSILAETTYNNIIYKEQPCVLVTTTDVTEKLDIEKKMSSLKVTRQQKITLATINGQEMERDQIGKELHENINQLLAAAKFYLELAKSNVPSRIDFIEQAEQILSKAIDENRSLSHSLAPPMLNEISFKDSLKELFRAYLSTHTFNISLSVEEEVNTLDHEILVTLFRIIQEQLNNILKHALAKNIIISLTVTDKISLSIEDDGIGFDTLTKHKGSGITKMRNRVELYHGTVKIISARQQGYTLLIDIPHKKKDKNKDCQSVIIVEDDADDRLLIARAFAEVTPTCNLTWLSDGSLLTDLLQSLADNELPSLIIMDYNMPLLNGLETLKMLELDQRVSKIPKIIYSSTSQNNIRNLCISANAKAFITKGINMDEIKENIHEMLTFV